MRVNMVPRDGGNSFRGSAIVQLRRRELRLRQLRLARHRPALHALEPERQQDVQPQQHADQRRRDQEDLGRQSVNRRPDPQEQDLVQLHVQALGLDQDQGRRLRRQEPLAVHLRPGLHAARRRRWPHRQQRRPHFVAGDRARTRSRSTTTSRRKYRDHWGIAATIPPEAAGVQVTPTSRVNVTKWTRTHTNKLLLEGGFGYYNQEYTELYQPSVTGIEDKVWSDEAIINARVYNVLDQSNNRQANAWPNPADHFSILRTFMGAASYVDRRAQLPRRRELDDRRLEAADAMDRRHAADHLQRRPPGVGDAAPAVGSQQRRRSRPRPLPAGQVGDGPRHAEPRPPLRPVHRRIARELGVAEPLERRRDVRRMLRRHGRSGRPLHRPGAELEGHLAARRLRDGRVRQRPHRGQGELRALRRRPGDRVRQPGEPDRRADRVGHARRGPTSTATACRSTPTATSSSTSSTNSASTPTFGRLTVPTTQYSPDLLRGWGKRGYNDEVTFAMQHQLADRISVNGGYYRRTFGNADLHRRPALRRQQLRLVLHHGADAIRTCRTAAATRCAACRT